MNIESAIMAGWRMGVMMDQGIFVVSMSKRSTVLVGEGITLEGAYSQVLEAIEHLPQAC